ncbi:hypothetical protein BZA77DRAFT_345101 [Pyronema omphalodes]|nr:hypothetical protein BZA77DRAFT_345101 [Pyronema omphalodes]
MTTTNHPRVNTATHPLILTRLYHRWIPRLAKEPTSTLLLITPLNRFLELRFSRTSTPLLLHATAGTYLRTATHGIRGYTISTADAENQVHTLHHQMNGDILETGMLTDPVDGVEKGYEAVWRISEVNPRLAVVMVLTEGGGMVVRVGAWCQGVMKIGNEVTAERWMRDRGGWRRIAKSGAGRLPCSIACLDRDEEGGEGGKYLRSARGLGFVVSKTLEQGDVVLVEKLEWRVVEKCVWNIDWVGNIDS